MRVRHATLDDLPAMIEMGESMRRESVIPFPKVNAEMVELVARELFPRRDVFCALVAEDERGLAGMLTGLTSCYMFSPDLIAQHDIFYVRPSRRGSAAARNLVHGFIAWAREVGAVRVLVGIGTGLRPEKTGRFYRMFGFTHMGGMYCREVG